MPNEKSISPSSRIGAEKVVVTKAMLDVGYDILDEYLSYNNGFISRFILEEAFRAMCLCWLQESAVESGASDKFKTKHKPRSELNEHLCL